LWLPLNCRIPALQFLSQTSPSATSPRWISRAPFRPPPQKARPVAPEPTVTSADLQEDRLRSVTETFVRAPPIKEKVQLTNFAAL